MSAKAASPPHQGLASGPERKRLGQYFTGIPLARLLAAIAVTDTVGSVVDPMAGTGDMLQACLDLNYRPRRIGAVEIDARPLAILRKRFDQTHPSVNECHGSAFDHKTWKTLGYTWDLVITNPPYIRYQEGSSGTEILPSSEQVRAGLSEVVKGSSLSPSDRAVFLEMVDSYSGLADLAVPSWILCMALVPVGGRVGMVVPNSWLSREYAAPVFYLLRRFFDTEVVCEDADGVWFDDAIVRATLVVARRAEDKGTSLADGGHWFVDVSTSASSDDSIVGQAFPESGLSEKEFATWIADESRGQVKGLVARWADQSDWCARIEQAGLEEATRDASKRSRAPQALRDIIRPELELLDLAQLGWSIGQGLRTGANDFFYVTRNADTGEFSSRLLAAPLELPSGALRAAMVNQTELPASFRCQQSDATRFLICLDGYALPDECSSSGCMPAEGDLEVLIRAATNKTYTRKEREVPLPELSAVRTNVRQATAEKDGRAWYHLPPLTDRHLPKLFLPRICDGTPRTYMNADPPLVIDANFSSLWPSHADAMDVYAVLAIMNSTWTSAWLETACTVLGAGALKVEAADLRYLTVPATALDSASELSSLGRRLVNDSENHQEIQVEIAAALALSDAHLLLVNLIEQHLRKRGNK